MAKEKGEKTNLYLLAIVGIVAVVGIVVLVLNAGSESVTLSSDDLSGETLKVMNADLLKEYKELKKLLEKVKVEIPTTVNEEKTACVCSSSGPGDCYCTPKDCGVCS